MTGWQRLIKSEGGVIPLLLALLIAAAGIISVGVIMLNRTSGAMHKGKANSEQLADLEKAIRANAYLNSRLPCPAHGDRDGGAKPAALETIMMGLCRGAL